MATAPRIVCIAPSWLGDAVLSLPALEWLARSGARVEVLARRGTERVYADHVAAGCLHTTSATSRVRRWRDAWALRRRDYAAVLTLPPSFAAALLARATGAPVRVGSATHQRGALLTHAIPAPSRDTHLSLAYLALARTVLDDLGAPAPPDSEVVHEPSRLRLRPHAHELQAAAALLAARGLQGSTLVVAPGARYGPAKCYPPERFAAAAGTLAARLGAGLLLVGGASDRGATAAVQAHLAAAGNQGVDLAGETSLAELIGLLAGARGVLANDSGVMHLAAALGTPVVGIFGSTNPRWTGPLGPRTRVLAHPVPCSPCYLRRCPIDFPCMLGIAPGRLVEALSELLAAPASAPGI